MRPVLSEDQQFFRETTARFLDEFAPPGELRRLRDDPAGFGRDYWRRGADLGWTSLLVSEAQGGGSISGEGLIDLTLVAHEFGTHAAPGPLVVGNMVAAALSDAGSHPDVLGALLSGTSIATWCAGGTTVGARSGGVVGLRADDGDFVLDGVARPVESASHAEYLLVTAANESGITQMLVPAGAPGVTCTPMRSVDLTRRFDVVTFDGVRIPRDAVVGEVGAAGDAVQRQLQYALVLCAAESVGAMQRAFDITHEWAFDRYSFGRPLASYQALKHRFADMKVWLEASHALADEAASAVASQAADAAEKVPAAKTFIGEYGSELMHECVQLHGGLGVTFEHDVHLFLRRHTLDRALFGTPAHHRQQLAAVVIAKEAAA